MITGQKERQTTLFASQQIDGEEQTEEIDFKMVTFSLGGKEYGVDIMKVKEIAKFENFTYVPNTQPFVTGVYNLRGDIISVIDMRIMFNLPAAQRGKGDTQDGLILRLEGGLIGVVVDSIDRVVGISSETIQPPHPIFADINIKYISGVVEYDERLYIILDVDRILGEDAESTVPEQASADAPASAREPGPADRGAGPAPQYFAASGGYGETADMVAPTLATLSGFTMSDLNRSWVEGRLRSWADSHGGTVEITAAEQVEEFLTPFYSPFTGRFWEESYLDEVKALLPQSPPGPINVWNPGCGRGYESYSLACLLRSSFPEARLKIWAGDNDLLAISTAPNLVFEQRAVPRYYEQFIVEGSGGLSFQSQIRESVLFEFSDVTHGSATPPCDLVVIRDLLSFLPDRDQRRVVNAIEEKLKPDGLVIAGVNEDLAALGSFTEVSKGGVRAFRIA